MNRGELKTEILVRSGKDTTSSWLSETYLNNWINQEHRWASGYKPWPYTEGRTSTTYTTVEEWDFEGYKADSFRIFQIGGKKLEKLNFEDYQIFREKQSSSADRVFSDFGDLVFINPNIDLSGTITAWGQYQPANITDDDTDTVFSADGDEGNQAIIERVLGRIANRDNEFNQAIAHNQLGEKKLTDLWKRILDEQYQYKTKDRGMFKGFDVLDGGYRENNTDQFLN